MKNTLDWTSLSLSLWPHSQQSWRKREKGRNPTKSLLSLSLSPNFFCNGFSGGGLSRRHLKESRSYCLQGLFFPFLLSISLPLRFPNKIHRFSNQTKYSLNLILFEIFLFFLANKNFPINQTVLSNDRRRFRRRCFRWRTGRFSLTFWSSWNSITSRISLLYDFLPLIWIVTNFWFLYAPFDWIWSNALFLRVFVLNLGENLVMLAAKHCHCCFWFVYWPFRWLKGKMQLFVLVVGYPELMLIVYMLRYLGNRIWYYIFVCLYVCMYVLFI